MPWKTDYQELHDRNYRRLRAQAEAGWSNVEIVREMHACLRRALERKQQAAGGCLLELGCGDCGLSLALAQAGFEVFGIDLAPTALAWAREKDTGAALHLCRGSVLRLPYADDSFEVVVDGHCLHCIVPPDRDAVFGEVRRVLKPGGLFLLMSMCNDPHTPELRELFDPVSRCLVNKEIAGRYLGVAGDIVREVEQAGLRILHRYEEAARDEQDQDMVMIEASKS